MQTAAIGRRGLVAGVAAAALALGGLALAFARPGLPTASFASSVAPTLPSTSSGLVGGVEPRGILAFLSTQQVGADPFPRRQVYTVNPDGTNRRLRSRLTDNVRWFAWEPGGRRLAYAGEALGPQIVDLASDGQPRPWPGTWNQDRVVINGLGPAPSSDEQIPANELRIGDLQWLPDGKALVVTNRGVGFLAADGTSFRPMPGLVSADEAARNVSADELRIARDGQTIVYRRLAADGGFDLWVTSVVGGQGIQVTSRVEAFDPTWSPDGTRIAFRGQVGTGPIDIWTVSAQGTDAHPLSTDDQTDGSPSWSPYGSWIVWRRAVGGDQRLWVMTPDGTERHQLPIGETGEELESPIWAPTP
jgi:hypothetical protein